MPQRPVIPAGMTVKNYVELGFYVAVSVNRALLQEVTDTLGLSPKREVARLSGGQAQRVVLARALVQQPDVLLLDEPTSAFDIGHALDVLELIDTMRTTRNLTVLATMHDLAFAGLYSQRVALMDAGRIIAVGRDVLTVERVEKSTTRRLQNAGPSSCHGDDQYCRVALTAVLEGICGA